MIFNVVVDAVLWHWVTVVTATESTEKLGTEGLGWDIKWMAEYFMLKIDSLRQRGKSGYSGCSMS